MRAWVCAERMLTQEEPLFDDPRRALSSRPWPVYAAAKDSDRLSTSVQGASVRMYPIVMLVELSEPKRKVRSSYRLYVSQRGLERIDLISDD